MKKKTLILGGVLIILLALIYVYQKPLKEWQRTLGLNNNFLARVDVSEVDGLEIIKNGQTVNINRQEDRWKVAGTKDFYVSTALAADLVDQLESMDEASLELVSTNADNKNEFGLSEGVRVKIYEDGKLATDFIVGKTASDFTSSYVARADDVNTYLVDLNLNSVFNRDEWRDNVIFNIDTQDINKIRMQYPNREFTLEKKDDTWQGTKPYQFSVDKEKMESVVAIMSDLTAVEIPKQDFTGTGLEKNLIIIQAEGEGINHTLMIGEANDNGDYYVKRADSDNIYLITSEERDTLNKFIWQLQ